MKSKRKVASALRAYSRRMDTWAKWSKKTAKLRHLQANIFLLWVMLERSVLAETTWEAAEWINDAISNETDPASFWKNLRGMEPHRLRGFMRYGSGGYAFHRHYKTFARLLPLAARHIIEEYGSDPRNIWNNQRDVEVVRERLEEIPLIGPALSRWAALNLARNYGLLGGKKAAKQLDVKPDIHVKRVFRRTGLVKSRATDRDVIETARILAPDFPASLDAPCWEIGREWCKRSSPKCNECPIQKVCPKLR